MQLVRSEEYTLHVLFTLYEILFSLFSIWLVTAMIALVFDIEIL